MASMKNWMLQIPIYIYTIQSFLIQCFLGDSLQNVCPVEWHDDQCKVVLEVFEEGSKSGKDSEPSTLRDLFEEFEENSLEYTLNNHDCLPRGTKDKEGSGDGGDDGDSKADGGYNINPKKTKVYFQYAPLLSGPGAAKHSNVASLFSMDIAWIHSEHSSLNQMLSHSTCALIRISKRKLTVRPITYCAVFDALTTMVQCVPGVPRF